MGFLNELQGKPGTAPVHNTYAPRRSAPSVLGQLDIPDAVRGSLRPVHPMGRSPLHVERPASASRMHPHKPKRFAAHRSRGELSV